MAKRFYLDDFIAKFVTGRTESLFAADIQENMGAISSAVFNKSVLVIGGAGSIGSAYIKSLLPFFPASVTVVDFDENGLAELVRDLRSDAGVTMPTAFFTYPIVFGCSTFHKLITNSHYDIICNFAAHKHVRSDKDRLSVEAMLRNNVLSTHQLLQSLSSKPSARFFCVSTDKAANPVNMMGASKKLMEDVLAAAPANLQVSTARFANVAFSNGSLPDGFLQRIQKRQPLAAPRDVKRFFISAKEAGDICLLASVLAKPGEVFFPVLPEDSMKDFSTMAINLLVSLGYDPLECNSEEEARQMALHLRNGSNQYPVYFFNSDTTGEKQFEEFYTDGEHVDKDRFRHLGVIARSAVLTNNIHNVIQQIEAIFKKSDYSKSDIVALLSKAIPSFQHLETGKYLDERM